MRVFWGILCALTVFPASAAAEETITAAPSNRYSTPSITIDQGETVTFSNTDGVMHDVTSSGQAADGQRLFASELIGRGKRAPVKGAESLTTGAYGFFCSVHPNMTGTINVTSAGTPVPRATPTPTATPAPRGPKVTLRVGAQRASKVRSAKRIVMRFGLDKPASVVLTASIGATRIARLAETFDSAGTAELWLPVAKLSRVKAGRRLKIRVVATDSSGLTTTRSRTVRLR